MNEDELGAWVDGLREISMGGMPKQKIGESKAERRKSTFSGIMGKTKFNCCITINSFFPSRRTFFFFFFFLIERSKKRFRSGKWIK